MQVEELLERARETFGARREYAEPYERNGVTVIAASAVRGGGGGGTDHDGDTGGGFGIAARPAGAWVIHGDAVDWKPAIDPMRIVLGLELIAGLALLRRERRHHTRLKAARRQIRAHRPRRTPAHRLHLPLH